MEEASSDAYGFKFALAAVRREQRLMSFPGTVTWFDQALEENLALQGNSSDEISDVDEPMIPASKVSRVSCLYESEDAHG